MESCRPNGSPVKTGFCVDIGPVQHHGDQVDILDSRHPRWVVTPLVDAVFPQRASRHRLRPFGAEDAEPVRRIQNNEVGRTEPDS